MQIHIKRFLITFFLFLSLDFVWLTRISPQFYHTHIAHLLAPHANLGAAVSFYFIFISGLVYFSVEPASRSYEWKAAFFRGFFFGLVTYGTFDLTSQAVFRDWPTIVTLVDLSWGAFISGFTTLIVARLTLTL